MIMKAMPDVDIFVVLEQVDQAVLDRVWGVAQEKGCAQSDFDLNRSLLRIEEVMDSWREGLTEHYSVDQLVDMVRQRSHRARQLLLHPKSEAILRERVARWRRA